MPDFIRTGGYLLLSDDDALALATASGFIPLYVLAVSETLTLSDTALEDIVSPGTVVLSELVRLGDTVRVAPLPAPAIIPDPVPGSYPVLTFTTPPVSGLSTGDFNIAVGLNRFVILKLTITPSVTHSKNRFEIYQSTSFDVSTIAYATLDFTGPLLEPMEDNGRGPVERAEGVVCTYNDDDDSATLHLRIVNLHSATQTYDVGLTYWPFWKLAGSGDVSVIGDPDDGVSETSIALVADATRQKIAVQTDSDSVGVRAILNLKSGARMTLSGTLSGSTAAVTLTANVQTETLQPLFWALRGL